MEGVLLCTHITRMISSYTNILALLKAADHVTIPCDRSARNKKQEDQRERDHFDGSFLVNAMLLVPA
ncbi:hypothetical protein KIN20_020330 [Parelaphostrongylus tenuis]|uniref:Uncharacterized protein n=1 Tax=Parelaphostrongylus tenuis TaxID=148309 RepID=A0AAD5MMF6_PARTN|nr:hypothetical protein KIN20_020330 [Parelaphostrongylus tenuis]